MRRAIAFLALTLSCGGTAEVAFGTGGGKSTGTGIHTGAGGSGASSTGTGTGTTSVGGGGSTTTTTTTSMTTSTTTTPSGACSGLTKGPGEYDETLADPSGTRKYRVRVPASYSASTPTSVVLVFHGLTQSASGIEDNSKMDPVADAHGFISVYPQGISNSWNAGTCCGTASSQQTPDVAFVSHLIDALKADYCVDEKRVFATGLSNGGMLSHRLACELSDRIAAIGAVAGTFAVSDCAPPRPVAVMHVHGTADFVVPYNGGNLGGAKSVPETISKWVAIDGCTDPAPVNVYKQGDASCDEYQMCKEGTRVRLCTIDQGGHQWPGGTNNFLGHLSTDLAASEEVLKFFEAHPMP